MKNLILLLILVFCSCNQKVKQHNTIEAENKKPLTEIEPEYMNEGNRHAFVKEVLTKENQKNYIIADFIDFLTGDKAVEKAKEFGDAANEVSKSGDTTYFVPNDYYLSNANPQLRTLELAKEVKIELLAFSQNKNGIGYEVVSLKEFKEQIKNHQIMILKIENEIVVEMKEQYTP